MFVSQMKLISSKCFVLSIQSTRQDIPRLSCLVELGGSLREGGMIQYMSRYGTSLEVIVCDVSSMESNSLV